MYPSTYLYANVYYNRTFFLPSADLAWATIASPRAESESISFIYISLLLTPDLPPRTIGLPTPVRHPRVRKTLDDNYGQPIHRSWHVAKNTALRYSQPPPPSFQNSLFPVYSFSLFLSVARYDALHCLDVSPIPRRTLPRFLPPSNSIFQPISSHRFILSAPPFPSLSAISERLLYRANEEAFTYKSIFVYIHRRVAFLPHAEILRALFCKSSKKKENFCYHCAQKCGTKGETNTELAYMTYASVSMHTDMKCLVNAIRFLPKNLLMPSKNRENLMIPNEFRTSQLSFGFHLMYSIFLSSLLSLFTFSLIF